MMIRIGFGWLGRLFSMVFGVAFLFCAIQTQVWSSPRRVPAVTKPGAVVYEAARGKPLGRFREGTRVQVEYGTDSPNSRDRQWVKVLFRVQLKGRSHGWMKAGDLQMESRQGDSSRQGSAEGMSRSSRYWGRAGMDFSIVSLSEPRLAIGETAVSQPVSGFMAAIGYSLSERFAIIGTARSFSLAVDNASSGAAASTGQIQASGYAAGIGAQYEFYRLSWMRTAASGGVELTRGGAGNSRGSASIRTNGIISPAPWMKLSAIIPLFSGVEVQLDAGYRSLRLPDIQLYPSGQTDNQRVSADFNLGGPVFAASVGYAF